MKTEQPLLHASAWKAAVRNPTAVSPSSGASLAAWAAVIISGLLTASANAKLNVVVTTPDLAAITEIVGKDHVSITTLAKPTEDPHFVDPKPSFIVKLNRADALVEGGAELEAGWLSALIDGSRNSRLVSGGPGRISCAASVELLEVPTALDRSRGDVHAAGNPHFMVDPENARRVAKHIAQALGRLDAPHKGVFESNAAEFAQRIDAKLLAWQKALEPFKGKRVVAYHNTWPYFARRFGVKVDLFLEPKPGVPPSPAHLAQVISTMKSERVRAILLETFQHRRTAESVADATGAHIIAVTQYPGGLNGSDADYIAMMDHIVMSLAKALAAAEPR